MAKFGKAQTGVEIDHVMLRSCQIATKLECEAISDQVGSSWGKAEAADDPARHHPTERLMRL
jgi:hypothetical protein